MKLFRRRRSGKRSTRGGRGTNETIGSELSTTDQFEIFVPSPKAPSNSFFFADDQTAVSSITTDEKPSYYYRQFQASQQGSSVCSWCCCSTDPTVASDNTLVGSQTYRTTSALASHPESAYPTAESAPKSSPWCCGSEEPAKVEEAPVEEKATEVASTALFDTLSEDDGDTNRKTKRSWRRPWKRREVHAC